MAEAIGGGTDASAFVGGAGARARVEPRRAEALEGRRFSADERDVLWRWAERATPAAAVGAATALLICAPQTSAGARAGVGLATGAAFAASVALLVGGRATRRAEQVVRAAFLALVIGAVAGRLAERMGAPVVSSAARLLVVAALGAAAMLAVGWLATQARQRGTRRVLLLDGATAADATRAVGAATIVLIGPVARENLAALRTLGAVGVDDVVVARPLPPADARAISCALGDAAVRVHGLVTDGGEAPPKNVVAFPSGWAWRRRGALGPGAALAKRGLDLSAALVLLAMTAPLFGLVALLIKLTSRGPVFFAQPRVGPRGVFRALKFRTMYVGAHLAHEKLMDSHGTQFKLRRDPRVTGVGRLLRRFSVDELPQLLQILTGRMSLVGPRPPMPEEVKRYTDGELRRLGVTPGLTGLWQVSGRADLSFADCVALDARYIEEWSPRLELKILGRTAGAVLGGRGAY